MKTFIIRYAIILFFIFTHLITFFAQDTEKITINSDSLIFVTMDPGKGFYHDYILFIPKGTPLKKKLFLLVEPNNTGKITDSIEVHKKYAIDLASVSSVGNNVSTELKIPLLVPVFPRPASQPLMYTHALDRDIMLETTPALERLDLQLLKMIKDAGNILNAMNIKVEPKFFMNGFSASATFTNRFSFMHPEEIQALAIGGFNGKLMIPQGKINDVNLNYPVGINDLAEISGNAFDMNTYRKIPQYIYMGALDDNDAVQYDDAYSEQERNIINEQLGSNVQQRYLECQKIYANNDINAVFKTYEKVGHWTTAEMNLEVIKFFLAQLKEIK